MPPIGLTTMTPNTTVETPTLGHVEQQHVSNSLGLIMQETLTNEAAVVARANEIGETLSTIYKGFDLTTLAALFHIAMTHAGFFMEPTLVPDGVNGNGTTAPALEEKRV